MTTTTPAKKRLSKKSKGSWRKIEHNDVENYLDDQRLEERIGKIAEKTNEELFVLDTTPQQKKSKKKGLTVREKRKILLKRTPKCFAALENDSKVTDPIVKRNRVRTAEERKHPVLKKIEKENAKKGIVKPKLLKSVEDREKSYQASAAKRSKNKQLVFEKDLWSTGDLREEKTGFKNEWVDRKTAEYHTSNTGTAVVSAPKDAFQKSTRLRAVEIPHPGLSYNPTFKDHQDLMNAVEERELKLIKQEEHLNRVTTSMFNKMPAVERDINSLKELRSGIDDEEDDDEAASDSDDEVTSVNPPVVNKKKDAKARRKQKEQRQLKQELLKKKLEKKKVTDIHRLKVLSAEIKTMEEGLKEMRQRKLKRAVERKFQPGRLSKFAFEEEEIDVNLPEDITDSLRNLKTEGNMLKDRYKSLQRRNIVAPSKDLGLRRRREVKRFVRTTHKEIPEQPTKSKKKK